MGCAVYDPKVYLVRTCRTYASPMLVHQRTYASPMLVHQRTYEPQIKYLKAHPEKAKEIHARYLEKHRDDYNNYHKLYERAKYEWNTYVHNNKYKYEKKLFLKILLDDYEL
jgi:hypothetical protein